MPSCCDPRAPRTNHPPEVLGGALRGVQGPVSEGATSTAHGAGNHPPVEEDEPGALAPTPVGGVPVAVDAVTAPVLAAARDHAALDARGLVLSIPRVSPRAIPDASVGTEVDAIVVVQVVVYSVCVVHALYEDRSVLRCQTVVHEGDVEVSIRI